jgi:glucose/arabinose dehydrogenase
MSHRIAVVLLVASLAGACGDGATSSTAPTPSGPLPTDIAIASEGAPTAATPSPTTPATPSPIDRAPPPLTIEPVVDGLSDPLDIAWRPDDPGTLFVAEQGGRVRMVRDGRLRAAPFLDISSLVTAGGEQGLLGLAFLPSGEHGRVFVYYTAKDGSQVVASYDTRSGAPDQADPGSARIWLTMPDRFGNHNGGSLAFGPGSYLYIGTGDGGGGGDPLDSGRHLDTLLAKVLRIDVGVTLPSGTEPRYVIPADNPFVGTADARQEIWLTGLRNPWRIRFDRATGDLWIGDVGQNAWEEIDVARAGVGGLDYGWNLLEGDHCYRTPGPDCATPALTPPVTEYGHDQGCSVTGGTVYRGTSEPSLDGWYLFSDYCSGRFWAIDAALDRTSEPAIVAETGASISAIAEDASGELFATDLAGGRLLRIGVRSGA